MTLHLKLWGAYLRATTRWPAVRSIVPFVPVIALWALVVEAGMFPRVFLPGPLDVVRSFGSLVEFWRARPEQLREFLKFHRRSRSR